MLLYVYINLYKRRPGLRTRCCDSALTGLFGVRSPAGMRISEPVQADGEAHSASCTRSMCLVPLGKSAGAWR